MVVISVTFSIYIYKSGVLIGLQKCVSFDQKYLSEILVFSYYLYIIQLYISHCESLQCLKEV